MTRKPWAYAWGFFVVLFSAWPQLDICDMTIQEWLKNGKPYQEGVALYEEYGDSDFLKGMFRKGPTIYNRERLAEELQEINAVVGQIADAIEKKIMEDPFGLVKAAFDLNKPPAGELVIRGLPKPVSEYPDEVQKLMRQAADLWDQMHIRHWELDMNKRFIRGIHEDNWPYLSKAERKANALGVLQLKKEHVKIWTRINTYLQTGRLELATQPGTQLPEGAALIGMRNNMRSVVSKWKSRLKKADSEERKKYCEKQLAEATAQLQVIEEKIDNEEAAVPAGGS